MVEQDSLPGLAVPRGEENQPGDVVHHHLQVGVEGQEARLHQPPEPARFMASVDTVMVAGAVEEVEGVEGVEGVGCETNSAERDPPH